MSTSDTLQAERTMTISRTLDAPRDLVFETWSTAEHLRRWFGPQGFTLSHCEIDFRPGGRWHFCMSHPEYPPGWGIAIYREIAPPERIVYTDAFSDEAGNVVPPESVVTVTFDDDNGKTRLTVETVYATKEDYEKVAEMGAREGWEATLDSLVEHLAGMAR